MIVTLSPRAERDLTELLDDLLTKTSPRTALRIVEAIEKRCFSLERFPDRGAPLRLAGREGLRRLFEDPYVIVYRRSGSTVEIVTIVHGTRDIAAKLASDDDGSHG